MKKRSITALALGLCGGYPVGARTSAELTHSGMLTREEGERLLSFCNNAGPGFLLGICGGAVFSSPRAGAALYLIHVASALFTGILLCRRLPPLRAARPVRTADQARMPLSSALPAAIQGALSGILNVCAFVIFFTVLARLVLVLLPDAAAQSLPCAALLGLLELTSGVTALPNSRAGFLLCAAMLGWGGLSVHCQTAAVTAGSGIPMGRYLPAKAVQAALSAGLAWLAAPHLLP